MAFRLLHSADWHLGQTLHGQSREVEHTHFLDWLVAQIAEQAIDALIVAGDIFDSPNPPVTAQRLLFQALARARTARPSLQVILIAGNHDSGGRLEAPAPLFESLGIHIVGSLPRTPSGLPDLERIVVPLYDSAGTLAALCVAIPFLRPGDLPPSPSAGDSVDDAEDSWIAGVRALYGSLCATAAARLQPAQALIVTGHAHMIGGSLSDCSERRILSGHQHALPATIFPDNCTYVALGHLHRAQRVGGRETVRYSGAPLPLALDEDHYPHQVRVLDFADGVLQRSLPLPVPRRVAIRRCPTDGTPQPLPQVLAELAALPRRSDNTATAPLFPYLEVLVALERPHPGLREEIEAVLADKAVRLLKLTVRSSGDATVTLGAESGEELAALSPEIVLRRLYARTHAGEPEPELLAAFHELEILVREQNT